jgi:hypothetical protein
MQELPKPPKTEKLSARSRHALGIPTQCTIAAVNHGFEARGSTGRQTCAHWEHEVQNVIYWCGADLNASRLE